MGCTSSKNMQTVDGLPAQPGEEVAKTQPNPVTEQLKTPIPPEVKIPEDVHREGTTSVHATAGTEAGSTVAAPVVQGELPADARIIFVLGGPGSGKGTQCDRVKAKYHCTHLSAGDLLREEVKKGSELGQQLEATMKEGKLVPQEVTIALLKQAMIRSGAHDFLVDGFPRALDQAETFERSIQPCELVLFFDCPEATMEERLLSRGKTSGRSDDNAETIRKRFQTFQNESLPVVQRYEAEGKARKISAVPPPEDVFAEVEKALDPIFGKGARSSSNLMALVQHKQGELPAHSKIVFVLGGPGSGKGTQCEKIKARYGYTHLSSGDLLRDEVKGGSELGKALEATMAAGELVPTEVTVALLRNAMFSSGGAHFLIDGFPRALDQAEVFERDIKPCQLVLFFDCPEPTMEERLLDRGKTSGRSDDNAATIKKRFHTFVNSSLPVVEHFERQGKLHRISAVPPPAEVFKHVEAVLDKLQEAPTTAA